MDLEDSNYRLYHSDYEYVLLCRTDLMTYISYILLLITQLLWVTISEVLPGQCKPNGHYTSGIFDQFWNLLPEGS